MVEIMGGQLVGSNTHISKKNKIWKGIYVTPMITESQMARIITDIVWL